MRVFKVEEAVECKVLRRLNRFVVEVIADGKRLRAHINNTGRLSEFLVMVREPSAQVSRDRERRIADSSRLKIEI